jgi:FO synthase
LHLEVNPQSLQTQHRQTRVCVGYLSKLFRFHSFDSKYWSCLQVTYVINRNINYTNVCGYRCQFCAFSKGRLSENLRGKPYILSLEEIGRRAAEAWSRGATEVCMQGGIHPDFTGQTYLDILEVVKAAAPEIHVHAFSPLEVFQGAATLGIRWV